jgi:argonaute-like protein implicated in RNA metabolism and viral defense
MSIQKTSGVSRIDFERAINSLQEQEPHIVLAIIPDSDSLDEDEWGPYYDFKSLMMDISLPSQVIDQATVLKTKSLKYVMQNVALGMIAKMGHIPYILANPLNYADFVVGIDIARKRNKSGVGSQNAAALAQIYHQGGHFAHCRVIETPLEGETVPAPILRGLFPLNEFEGKTVIIHRDGLFRGNEVEIIKEHMTRLRAKVYFVEVIKSGAPRLYKQNGSIVAPEIGTTFLLSDTEAFIVTSTSSTATPQPLHIRTEEPFTIGKALHSVLMLTLMHHGSLKRPRLPISIHYSDKIGYLALRGVKPRGGQSTDMYWL